MSASESAKKTEEERTISASKLKVQEVESDDDDKYFEWYRKSDSRPVHTDIIDKEITEGRLALALQPNISEEEEINNNDETMGGSGIITVRRSNRLFKPPDRLGKVPYFLKQCSIFDINRTNPEGTTKAQIDDNGDRLGRKLRSE